MDWTSIIITIATTLCGGGIGALATLSATRRKAEFGVWEAQLEEMRKELTYERERNAELMRMCVDKESRFVEQTRRLRETQGRELELMRAKSLLELELANKRCDDHACPYRRPPTASTPPPPELTRDQWHAMRKDNNDNTDTL